jgi:uncharacterized protein YeaO (DUF488 family)
VEHGAPAPAEGEGVIRVKRVYEQHAAEDGLRFLVERLWPRGMTKAQLQMDAWLKDAAPSHELRRWYGHDPGRWSEFRQRYEAELGDNPAAWLPLREAARRQDITLLFSAHDLEHNSAVALQSFLEARLESS